MDASHSSYGMNTVHLRLELLRDPVNIGYGPLIAAQDFDGVAERINAKRPEYAMQSSLLPHEQMREWAYQRDEEKETPLEALSAAKKHDSPLREMAVAMLDEIWSDEGLDLSLPFINNADPHDPGLIQSLVAAGVLSPKQEAKLLELRIIGTASRAEFLFGAGTFVSASDVESALSKQALRSPD